MRRPGAAQAKARAWRSLALPLSHRLCTSGEAGAGWTGRQSAARQAHRQGADRPEAGPPATAGRPRSRACQTTRVITPPESRAMLAACHSAFAGVRVSGGSSAPRAAAPPQLLVECAHKKGAGSVKNSQDSESKRLGVKIYGNQPAYPGNIILRQRGTVVRARGDAARGGDAWRPRRRRPPPPAARRRGARPAPASASGLRARAICGQRRALNPIGGWPAAPRSDSPARQWTPGPGCMMGKDHTIFAVEDGLVKFEKSSVRQRISIVQPQPVDESVPVPETRRTRKYAKCASCAPPPRARSRLLQVSSARSRARCAGRRNGGRGRGCGPVRGELGGERRRLARDRWR